jgi:hypothetical protein
MNKNKIGLSDPNKLFINKHFLSSATQMNTRIIFGWFDLLGKLGGITNVMMLLFGFFLFSLSEHSYILKASKKLFIARTKDKNLFKNDDRQNI